MRTDTINRIYLQLDFTQGSVTEEGHKGWIEATGFAFAMEHGTENNERYSHYNENSRPHFAPLIITKFIDRASPDILMTCATSTQTTKVLLDVCDTKGVFFRYTLKDARIISVNANVAHNNTFVEELKLSYASIYSWYQDRDSKGKVGFSNEGGYSLKENKPIFKP